MVVDSGRQNAQVTSMFGGWTTQEADNPSTPHSAQEKAWSGVPIRLFVLHTGGEDGTWSHEEQRQEMETLLPAAHSCGFSSDYR